MKKSFIDALFDSAYTSIDYNYINRLIVKMEDVSVLYNIIFEKID